MAIAFAAFIIVAGSFLFGHDHDLGADHGDMGHDGDSAGGEAAISIFSTKVMATLFMGFGAAGAIARHYGLEVLPASMVGVLFGGVLGGLMYGVLSIFYKQQASSLVPTSSTVGCTGTVTVSIGAGALGEVGLNIQDQYTTYLASAKDGEPIAKGQNVRVVNTVGSQLVVEKL
ncbi:MAG: hypothetical protein NTW03_12835 [Verrucomicrobia bacterium]|nr:hypothetical protein [Verrucomicrobiota bacterium]